MAMDLENIMQDTIVIEARARERKGTRGRSKKWKELMKMPPVSQCLYLKDEIEHTFEDLIENQPIGMKLFHEFCQKDLLLSRCVLFLQALDELQLMVDEKYTASARKTFEEYISTRSTERLNPVSAELAAKVERGLSAAGESLPRKSIFQECKDIVREFLSGQPFIDYVESHYYWRYLQWKYLERAPVTKNSFRVYRVLGKGGFGLVHACQSKPTGKMYALKKLEKKRVKKRKGEKLALNEKQILERVNSRFVVTLAYAYQSKDALCMVLTLMNGGDLRFHIHNIGSPGLSYERTIFYAAEIAYGLSHLHACRIAYRDMKPDNILLDDNGHVRISDLGLAVHIPEGQSVRGRVGTIGYMAPEVISNHRYSFMPDWWGLGCVVYEMIHGECPFRRRKEKVSREEVERRVRDDTISFPDKFTPEAKLFVSQLLEKHQSQRLGYGPDGFTNIREHPFFATINWTHLEKGVVEPPFKPNPRAVYAKDVLDIDPFSSVKGVDLEGSDDAFAGKFATGAVSKPWQEEMIDMKLYEDINRLYPIESMSLDSNSTQDPLTPPSRSRGNWFKKIFKFKRQQTSAPPKTSVAAPPPAKARPPTIVEGKATPTTTPTATAGASGGSPSLNSDRQHEKEDSIKEVQKQQPEENRVSTTAAANPPGQEKTEGQSNDTSAEGELDNQELSNKVDESGKGVDKGEEGERRDSQQGEGSDGDGVEVVAEEALIVRELSASPPTLVTPSKEQKQQEEHDEQEEQGGASSSGDSKDSSPTL